MAAKRTLWAVLTAGLTAGAGLAQTPAPPPAAPPASAGTGSPFLAPPAAPAPSATGVLTAPATGLPPPPPLVPGGYAGPYCGSGPAGGCNGPVGGNGPLTYELYLYTGPSFIVGGDKFIQAALGTGWALSSGGRTLHFNTTQDAAWTLTTGIFYLYSGGDRDYIGVATRPPGAQNQLAPVAEPVNAFRVKSFNRVGLEFAVGRDWWLDGPAGSCPGDWNSRVGVDVGGRWGHNSVSLNPLVNPAEYFRRSDTMHAVTLGAHYTLEVPMGAWAGFLGGRVQWAYNWTNVVPPIGGNTQDLGILFAAGVRF
jgi:hypothetical protein